MNAVNVNTAGTESRDGHPALSFNSVTVQVRSGSSWRSVVRDISFDLQRGEVSALVGESGSGKSLSALAGIGLLPSGVCRVSGGSIALEGQQVNGLRELELRRIRGSKVAMIFQEPMTALNPLVKVGSQIVDVVRAHTVLGRKAARARAVECLQMVGISKNRMGAYPHELSGGMRQRVLIAMAVACNPSVLIADEPTTALDVTVQAQIIDLLGSMVDELDMAMLFISHDFGVVAEIADRVHVMLAGEIVETAGVQQIFDHPQHEYTQGLIHMSRDEWLSNTGSSRRRPSNRIVASERGKG